MSLGDPTDPAEISDTGTESDGETYEEPFRPGAPRITQEQRPRFDRSGGDGDDDGGGGGGGGGDGGGGVDGGGEYERRLTQLEREAQSVQLSELEEELRGAAAALAGLGAAITAAAYSAAAVPTTFAAANAAAALAAATPRAYRRDGWGPAARLQHCAKS